MNSDPIREKLEERIMHRLKYTDVPAIELKYLSEAWHNLHQADLMAEIVNRPVSFGGFGGNPNEIDTGLAQLKTERE